MPRPHEDENAAEEIAVQDVVLNVVSVVLDAEGEQLENEAEQLNGGIVLLDRSIASRVGQQRCHKHVHAMLVEKVEKVRLLRLVDGGQHVLWVHQEPQNATQLHGSTKLWV